MSRWQRINALRRADWRLLGRALVAVVAIRAGLSVVRLGGVLRAVESLAVPRGTDRSIDVDHVVWAVEAASRRVPRATCLTRALATKLLLGRAGVESTVHLGFARGMAGAFEGHAWLESAGRIIVGNEEIERYTEIGTARMNEG